MKASVYIATSLDGFIAREDGDIDWLEGHESAGEGEDMGFQAFMDSVDALVMGRNTYDKVLSFDVGWPYGEKPVIVLTNRPFSPPDAPSANVSAMSGSPSEIVAQLSAQGMTHIYIDGGQLIQSFIRAGLVNQLIITTIPVLIGSGIPLFGSLPHDIILRLIDSRAYVNGFVQSSYALDKAASEE